MYNFNITNVCKLHNREVNFDKLVLRKNIYIKCSVNST